MTSDDTEIWFCVVGEDIESAPATKGKFTAANMAAKGFFKSKVEAVYERLKALEDRRNVLRSELMTVEQAIEKWRAYSG